MGGYPSHDAATFIYTTSVVNPATGVSTEICLVPLLRRYFHDNNRKLKDAIAQIYFKGPPNTVYIATTASQQQSGNSSSTTTTNIINTGAATAALSCSQSTMNSSNNLVAPIAPTEAQGMLNGMTKSTTLLPTAMLPAAHAAATGGGAGEDNVATTQQAVRAYKAMEHLLSEIERSFYTNTRAIFESGELAKTRVQELHQARRARQAARSEDVVHDADAGQLHCHNSSSCPQDADVASHKEIEGTVFATAGGAASTEATEESNPHENSRSASVNASTATKNTSASMSVGLNDSITTTTAATVGSKQTEESVQVKNTTAASGSSPAPGSKWPVMRPVPCAVCIIDSDNLNRKGSWGGSDGATATAATANGVNSMNSNNNNNKNSSSMNSSSNTSSTKDWVPLQGRKLQCIGYVACFSDTSPSLKRSTIPTSDASSLGSPGNHVPASPTAAPASSSLSSASWLNNSNTVTAAAGATSHTVPPMSTAAAVATSNTTLPVKGCTSTSPHAPSTGSANSVLHVPRLRDSTEDGHDVYVELTLENEDAYFYMTESIILLASLTFRAQSMNCSMWHRPISSREVEETYYNHLRMLKVHILIPRNNYHRLRLFYRNFPLIELMEEMGIGERSAPTSQADGQRSCSSTTNRNTSAINNMVYSSSVSNKNSSTEISIHRNNVSNDDTNNANIYSSEDNSMSLCRSGAAHDTVHSTHDTATTVNVKASNLSKQTGKCAYPVNKPHGVAAGEHADHESHPLHQFESICENDNEDEDEEEEDDDDDDDNKEHADDGEAVHPDHIRASMLGSKNVSLPDSIGRADVPQLDRAAEASNEVETVGSTADQAVSCAAFARMGACVRPSTASHAHPSAIEEDVVSGGEELSRAIMQEALGLAGDADTSSASSTGRRIRRTRRRHKKNRYLLEQDDIYRITSCAHPTFNLYEKTNDSEYGLECIFEGDLLARFMKFVAEMASFETIKSSFVRCDLRSLMKERRVLAQHRHALLMQQQQQQLSGLEFSDAEELVRPCGGDVAVCAMVQSWLKKNTAAVEEVKQQSTAVTQEANSMTSAALSTIASGAIANTATTSSATTNATAVATDLVGDAANAAMTYPHSAAAMNTAGLLATGVAAAAVTSPTHVAGLPMVAAPMPPGQSLLPSAPSGPATQVPGTLLTTAPLISSMPITAQQQVQQQQAQAQQQQQPMPHASMLPPHATMAPTAAMVNYSGVPMKGYITPAGTAAVAGEAIMRGGIWPGGQSVVFMTPQGPVLADPQQQQQQQQMQLLQQQQAQAQYHLQQQGALLPPPPPLPPPSPHTLHATTNTTAGPMPANYLATALQQQQQMQRQQQLQQQQQQQIQQVQQQQMRQMQQQQMQQSAQPQYMYNSATGQLQQVMFVNAPPTHMTGAVSGPGGATYSILAMPPAAAAAAQPQQLQMQMQQPAQPQSQPPRHEAIPQYYYPQGQALPMPFAAAPPTNPPAMLPALAAQAGPVSIPYQYVTNSHGQTVLVPATTVVPAKQPQHSPPPPPPLTPSQQQQHQQQQHPSQVMSTPVPAQQQSNAVNSGVLLTPQQAQQYAEAIQHQQVLALTRQQQAQQQVQVQPQHAQMNPVPQLVSPSGQPVYDAVRSPAIMAQYQQQQLQQQMVSAAQHIPQQAMSQQIPPPPSFQQSQQLIHQQQQQQRQLQSMQQQQHPRVQKLRSNTSQVTVLSQHSQPRNESQSGTPTMTPHTSSHAAGGAPSLHPPELPPPPQRQLLSASMSAQEMLTSYPGGNVQASMVPATELLQYCSVDSSNNNNISGGGSNKPSDFVGHGKTDAIGNTKNSATDMDASRLEEAFVTHFLSEDTSRNVNLTDLGPDFHFHVDDYDDDDESGTLAGKNAVALSNGQFRSGKNTRSNTEDDDMEYFSTGQFKFQTA